MRAGPAVAAFAILFVASAGPVDAQIGALGGSAATGEVIGRIGEELRATLDKATASGDFLGMRASQEALYVLDAFRNTNRDLLNTAFDRIGDERQALLNGLRETTRAIEEGRVDTLQRLEQTSSQIDSLVRETTFRTYPIIYRYRGSIVTPGEKQDVLLSIDGYRLGRETAPTLVFRGERYPAQVVGNTVRITLPRKLFVPEAERMRSENGVLEVAYRSGGVLGIGSGVRKASYDLPIITLPEKLATVELSFTEIATVERRERWEREESRRRSGHGGWDCHGYAFSPKTAERRFDVNETSVTRGSGNDNGKLEDVRVRDVGISFRICARRPYTSGGPGFRHAIVRATEIWPETVERPARETMTLTWTQDIPRKLPGTVKGLAVSVTDFTGNTRTVPAAGGAAGRFVRMTYDRDSDLVIVTPVVPNDLKAL